MNSAPTLLDSDNNYRITWDRQLTLLSSCLIKTVILTIGYLSIIGFKISHPAYIFIICFYFVLDVLPTLLLHFQYLNKGRNVLVTVDKGARSVTYQKGAVEMKYEYADIQGLQYHASYGGGSGWYSFGEYCYCKILFKGGFHIDVSCLMMKNVKHELESLLGVEAEKRLSFLPFVK